MYMSVKGVIITNVTDWLNSGVVGGGYNCKNSLEYKRSRSTNSSLWKFMHYPRSPSTPALHPGPPKMSMIIKEFSVVLVFKVDG